MINKFINYYKMIIIVIATIQEYFILFIFYSRLVHQCTKPFKINKFYERNFHSENNLMEYI